MARKPKKEKSVKEEEIKENLPEEEVQETQVGLNDEKTPEEEPETIDWKDRYLRLSAEFDNFKKRTLKEKMELMRTAGEDIFLNILPVIDDFDRAIDSVEKAKDIEALKEGFKLINSKFIEFLKQRGVQEIEAKGTEFNTDIHMAVTKIPAPTPELKGKVVDVITKGYYLKEKVLRFSQVVVGD